MTDTHTHLYTDEYPDGGASAVRAALDAGVWRMVFPNVDLDSIPRARELHRLFPLQTKIAIGLHPTELGEDWTSKLEAMEEILKKDPSQFCAIGECGIDLHWDKTNLDAQKEAFSIQYDWAVKYGLPLIIHCREAVDEILDVIASKEGHQPRMVFHSFTSDLRDVRKIREVCDPWFGINGVVTFKNAVALRLALPEIGLERIVLETDAPWLAPVPHRGQRNESAWIPEICRKVAEVLGIRSSTVEIATDQNASYIFGF